MNIETTDNVDTSALLRLIANINNERIKAEPAIPEAPALEAAENTTVLNRTTPAERGTSIQPDSAESETLPALGRYVNIWA